MTSDVAKVTTVKEIQQKLMALGYSVGASKDDGICGNDTKSGISKFQADNKPLSVTGIVDSATLLALKAKTMPVESPGDYSEGYSAGTADSAQTITAVEASGGKAYAAHPRYNPSWSDDAKNGYHMGYNEVLSGTPPGYTIEGEPEVGAVVTRNSSGGTSPIDEGAQYSAADSGGRQDAEASVNESKYAGGAAVPARHDNYLDSWSGGVKGAYWSSFDSGVTSRGFIYDSTSDMVASTYAPGEDTGSDEGEV